MSEIYEYTKTLTCPADLMQAINTSGQFSQLCEYVLVEDQNNVTISMVDVLPPAEITALETFVTNFVCPVPLPEPQEDALPPGEPDPTTGQYVSYAEMCITYAESQVTNRDWIQIGSASDSDSGIIMPLNGVITRATGHVESQNGSNKKSIDLYVNDTKYPDLLTFGAGQSQSPDDDDGDSSRDWLNQTRIHNDINIPFAAGDRIRLRGSMSSGKLNDTVVTVWYKWSI